MASVASEKASEKAGENAKKEAWALSESWIGLSQKWAGLLGSRFPLSLANCMVLLPRKAVARSQFRPLLAETWRKLLGEAWYDAVYGQALCLPNAQIRAWSRDAVLKQIAANVAFLTVEVLPRFDENTRIALRGAILQTWFDWGQSLEFDAYLGKLEPHILYFMVR